MFKKLLVGTDGSDSAEKAVAHAVGLAKDMEAALLVLNAYPEPKADRPEGLGRSEFFPGPEIGKAVLESVEKKYGGEASLRTVLKEGDAGDALVDVAEEERVDLIIVGNKGMTGAKRFVLGSVPNRVTHHAPCSVLIVKTT